MNTLVFQYAVEVARAGSITRAAENLYMAQPNLSKAIRELEESLGVTLFERTSKGVAPTPKGEVFLRYAAKILSQLEQMEAFCRSDEPAARRFTLCCPPASYAMAAYLRFAAALPPGEAITLQTAECAAPEAVERLASGGVQLAVVRLPEGEAQAFEASLEEKGLSSQLIFRYPPCLLLPARHPLAAEPSLAAASLAAYPGLSLFAGAGQTVVLGGDPLALLAALPNAYMWASPLPEETLRRYGLAARRCERPGGERWCDYLLYPQGYLLTPADRAFVDALFLTKNEVAFTELR